MNINNLVSSIGFKGNVGSDVIFLIVFLLVSFAISFALGKHKILVALLGVYASYTVVSMAKFDFLKEGNAKALFFLAVLVAFVIFFSRLIRASISGIGPILITKLVIGSAIVVGLSLSIIFNWFPAKDLGEFSTPATREFFTGDFYKFLWSIAPLVYLAVIRKKID
jgi:hypothetical protein